MGIDTQEIVYIPESANNENLKTCLKKGDVVLSKTAVPAASIVQLPKCNVSQDTIAVKIREKSQINSGYLVVFLNSKYGLRQMQRWFTGNVQMHLNLTDGQKVLVPKFSSTFQEKISKALWFNFELRELFNKKYENAEKLLLKEIGINDLQIKNELVNIKNFQESFKKSDRLDAEHFQVKYDILENAIKNYQNYCFIEDIRTDNYRGLQPEYIDDGELSVITSKHILEKIIDYENLDKTDLSNWNNQKKARIKKGDILTYTTGANIGRTQVYLTEDKALASNHVNILRLKSDYNSYYVGFAMNSIIGRLQTEKYCAGSAQVELYPKNIDQFIIPLCPKSIQDEITNNIQDCFNLKKQSYQLLEKAKQAVEIAIEKDEKSALEFIESEVADKYEFAH